jgi:hypothetical protein
MSTCALSLRVRWLVVWKLAFRCRLIGFVHAAPKRKTAPCGIFHGNDESHRPYTTQLQVFGHRTCGLVHLIHSKTPLTAVACASLTIHDRLREAFETFYTGIISSLRRVKAHRSGRNAVKRAGHTREHCWDLAAYGATPQPLSALSARPTDVK